ncbi:MAG: hybrid sensor histidine kinase/response regulator, partial [Pseudomonadota bacterium]
MKLKKAAPFFFMVVFVALCANGLLLVLIHQAHNRVVDTQEHRQKTMALTYALRQETENLTRLLRAYTGTGETRYLFYYYDILAIRKGEKPAPSGYDSPTYWDQVVAGRIRHLIPAEGVEHSLAERMKLLGFSAEELLGLAKILAATEAMTKIEQVAFAATQGLYDPVKKDFVSDGPPHLDFANKLVHGDEYNALRADLSAAVESLVSLADRRTGEEVMQAAHSLQRWIFFSLGNMAVALVMGMVAFQVIRRRSNPSSLPWWM